MPTHQDTQGCAGVRLPTSWGRSRTAGGAHTPYAMDGFWIALIVALYVAMLGLVWFCDRLLQRN